MKRFTPCLNPATLTGLPLWEFLAGAADAGFRSVELPIQQVVAHGPHRVRAHLDELGLSVAAGSGILPAGPVLPAPLLVDEDSFTAAMGTVNERLHAFETIGCPTATIVLNPRTSLELGQAIELAITRLRALGTAVGEHGIRLAVEAVGVTTGLAAVLDGAREVARTLPELTALLDEADNPHLAICVDSFHWAATGARHEHLSRLGDLIAHVQIADIPPEVAADDLTDTMRLFPGDGDLYWSDFAKALTEYAGPVSVELFNPELRRLPEAEIARRAFRAASGCWPYKDWR